MSFCHGNQPDDRPWNVSSKYSEVQWSNIGVASSPLQCSCLGVAPSPLHYQVKPEITFYKSIYSLKRLHLLRAVSKSVSKQTTRYHQSRVRLESSSKSKGNMVNVSKKEWIPSGGENRVIDLPFFHLKRPLVYIKYGGSYNDIFPKLAVHLYQCYKQIVQHVIGWNDHIGKVEKNVLVKWFSMTSFAQRPAFCQFYTSKNLQWMVSNHPNEKPW